MDRTKREKIHYRAVRNATYDPELARKARSWSAERILQELGVKVPTRVPKLRQLPPASTRERQRAEQRARLRLDKFKYMVASGVEIQKAREARYKSWQQIENIVRLAEVRFEIEDPSRKEPREQRKENWSEWAKSEQWPTWVERLAIKLNRENGFDDNASYGWAMVYYSYIDNMNINNVVQLYEVDPFDGNRYREIA